MFQCLDGRLTSMAGNEVNIILVRISRKNQLQDVLIAIVNLTDRNSLKMEDVMFKFTESEQS